MSKKTRSQRIVPEHPNHLVVRANNRRRLFSYPRERHGYLRLLDRSLEKTGCALHAICLMGNHVHLLLTPPTVEAASSCMKRVNQRYAQMRNATRGGSGKLFEQSFESAPIEDARHLAFAVMYIDANPHRAFMLDPWNYQWSSYAAHAGAPQSAKIPADMLTPDTWYRSLGNTAAERAKEYRRLFAGYVTGHAKPPHGDDGTAQHRPAKCSRRMLRPDGSSAAEARTDSSLRRMPARPHPFLRFREKIK